MPATTTITNDPLLFDKLLAPIEAALQRLDAEPLSQAAKKLGFRGARLVVSPLRSEQESRLARP